MPHVCENYKRIKNYWAKQQKRAIPFPEMEEEQHENKLDLVLHRHDEIKKDNRHLSLVLLGIVVAVVAASVLGLFILG